MLKIRDPNHNGNVKLPPCMIFLSLVFKWTDLKRKNLKQGFHCIQFLSTGLHVFCKNNHNLLVHYSYDFLVLFNPYSTTGTVCSFQFVHKMNIIKYSMEAITWVNTWSILSSTKITVSWDVTPCSLVHSLLKNFDISYTTFLEDCNLDTHHCENLKSHNSSWRHAWSSSGQNRGQSVGSHTHRKYLLH
jgi:hypothetical protein